MATVTETQTTTALVSSILRERLEQSEDPDPSTVAEGLVEVLNDDQIADVAYAWIRNMAVEISRTQRNKNLSASTQAETGTKWDTVSKTVKARPDIFAERIWLGQEFKFLGDCNRDDLALAEAAERTQGQAMIKRAEQYLALSNKLKRSRKSTVRQLKVAAVESIFS